MAARVRDVCEFLDEVGLREPPGGYTARVCYDDPCHLVHGQGVEAAPRRLLAQIQGVELVPHANPTRCCGAAGTYNLTQPDMARRVLEEKLDALEAADPDVIATGNPGKLREFQEILESYGVQQQEQMQFITEAEHVHSSKDEYHAMFNKLQTCIGADAV